DGHQFGDIVYARSPLHFNDTDYFFAALWRQRNSHSPAQILEISPFIDLRMIDDKSGPIAVFLSWPGRIGLAGRSRGLSRSYSERQGKERRRYEEASEKR